MKFVLLLALIISTTISAQECKLIRETDPYTKDTRLSTGFIVVSGGSVTVDADSKEIDILFSISGEDKCYDNNSSAMIYFEGSKVKTSLRNGGTMNCEGLFHFIFKNSANTTAVLKKITTQKITHIVFTGNNKKETTLRISPEQQAALLRLSDCLVTEAKSLIK
jgi:hypothetical protein